MAGSYRGFSKILLDYYKKLKICVVTVVNKICFLIFIIQVFFILSGQYILIFCVICTSIHILKNALFNYLNSIALHSFI